MKRFETPKVFTPERAFGPSHVGVVLVNTAGATIKDTKLFRGDTNGDAQHLADTQGITVIGVDRPMSGVRFPDPTKIYALNTDPSHEYGKLQAEIDEVIATTGLRRIIVTGRSVAGLAALELGRFGPNEVVACEPGGMYNQKLLAGYLSYQKYNANEHTMLANGTLALDVMPEPTDQVGFTAKARRIGTFLIGNVVDTVAYSQLLASNRSAESSEFIAAQLPETHLRLLFAEHSLVAPTIDPDAYQTSLRAIRRTAAETTEIAPTAGIEVVQYPRTSHISFNSRPWMSDLLGESIERQADLDVVA